MVEGSNDDPSDWTTVPVVWTTGGPSSLPAEGYVAAEALGKREYGVRFSALNAGATTPTWLASPATGASIKICEMPLSVAIDTDSDAVAQLVALTTRQTIYVCSWDVIADGTTTVQLVYGTGTNCASGTAALTGP